MFRRLQWLSAKNILENLKELSLRFPLVTIDTLVATICGYILTDLHNLQLSTSTEQILSKILLMAILGFPVLTGLTLISEKFKFKFLYHWLLQLGGIALLAIYYVVLPKNVNDFSMVDSTRLFISNIVAYLCALSLPFYERGKSLSFWRFVETAFARAVVSVFFSITLWAGIALSFAAVDYLFGVNIQGETYLKAWILIAGIFGAWFFLAGFPKVHDHLHETAESSKILRIFIQYICIPLLCIFFVILYTYFGKIVILWDWPKGGVADWILGFSSAGFLVYILAYPLLGKSEHPFLKKFFRVFFALVLPMVAVLALAIFFRVKEYGVTESRYLVMLGGIWLLGSSLYFLLSKQKELKVLPYLAALFLFFAAWGPWSMYSVSVRSQYGHLQNLLSTYHLVENRQVVKVADENTIPLKDRASIHSKIEFLNNHNRRDLLEPLFPNVKSTSTVDSPNYIFTEEAMKFLGISNFYDYTDVEQQTDYRYLNFGSSSIVTVHGFDTLIRNVNIFPGAINTNVSNYSVASTTYSFPLENNHVKIVKNSEEIFTVDLSPYLNGWVEKYGGSSLKPPEIKVSQTDEMKIDVENSKEHYRILFEDVSLHKEKDAWVIQSGNMTVLIDKK